MVEDDSIVEAPSVLNEVLAGQKLRETKSAQCLDIVESITVRKSKKLQNYKKKKCSTKIIKPQKRCNKANRLICCCSAHRKRIPYTNKLRKVNKPSKTTNRLLLTKSQYIRMLSKPKPNYFAPSHGKPIKNNRKSTFYQISNAEITRLSRPTRAKLLVTFQKYHDVLPASKLESIFAQLQRGNDDDNKLSSKRFDKKHKKIKRKNLKKKSKKKCCEMYAIEFLAYKFSIKLTAFLTLQCNRSRNIHTIEAIAELIFWLLRSADGISCHSNICTISEDMWEYLCASAHFLACILELVYCKYETIKERPPPGSAQSKKRDTEDKSDSFSSEESSQSDDGSAYGTAHLEIAKGKISPFYSTQAQQGRYPEHFIEITDDGYNKNTGQAAFTQLSRLERDGTPTRKKLYQQRDLSLRHDSKHYLEINTGDYKTGQATITKLGRLEQDRTPLGKQQLSQKSDTPKALKASKLEKLKRLEQVSPGTPQFSKKVDPKKTQKSSFSVRKPSDAIGVSDVPNLRSPKDKYVKQESSATDFSEDYDKSKKIGDDKTKFDHRGHHTPKQESPTSSKDIKQKHRGDRDSSDDDKGEKRKSVDKHRQASSKEDSPKGLKQTSPEDKKRKGRIDREYSDTSSDSELQKGRLHKLDDRPGHGSSKRSPTDGKQTSPKDTFRKRRGDRDSSDEDQDRKYKSADKHKHGFLREDSSKGPKQTSPKDKKQKNLRDRDSPDTSSDSDLRKKRKHKSDDRSGNGFSKRSPTDGKQTSPKDTLQKRRGDRVSSDDDQDRKYKSADKRKHGSSKEDSPEGPKQTSPKDKKQKSRRDRESSDISDYDQESKGSPRDRKQPSSKDVLQKDRKDRGPVDSYDEDLYDKHKSEGQRRHPSSKDGSPKDRKKSPKDTKQGGSSDSSSEDLGVKSKTRDGREPSDPKAKIKETKYRKDKTSAHRGWHEPKKKDDKDRGSSDISNEDNKSKNKLKSQRGDASSKEKKSEHRGWHKTRDSSPGDNETAIQSRRHKDLKDRRSSPDLSDGEKRTDRYGQDTRKHKLPKDGSSDSDNDDDLSKRKPGARSPRRHTSSSPRSHLSSSPLRESPDAQGKESPESPYGKRREHPGKKRTSRGSLSGKSSPTSESMLDALDNELSKSPTKDKNYFRTKKVTESEKDVIRDERGRPIKDTKITNRKSKEKIEKNKSDYADKSVKEKTDKDMTNELSIDEKSDNDVEKEDYKKRVVKPKKEGKKDEGELASDSDGSQKHSADEKLKYVKKKDKKGEKDSKSAELKKTILSDSKSKLEENQVQDSKDILEQEDRMRAEKNRQKSKRDKSFDESQSDTSSAVDAQESKKDKDKKDKTKDSDETETEIEREALSDIEVSQKKKRGFTDKKGKKADDFERGLLEIQTRKKDKEKQDADREGEASLSETEVEIKEKKDAKLKAKDERERESEWPIEIETENLPPDKRITGKLPQEEKPFESRVKEQEQKDLKSDKIVDDVSKPKKTDADKDLQEKDRIKSEDKKKLSKEQSQSKKKLVEDDSLIDADKEKIIKDDLKDITGNEKKKPQTSKIPVKDIKTDKEKDLLEGGLLDDKKDDQTDLSEESETTSEFELESEDSEIRKKDLPRVSLPDYIHGEDKEAMRKLKELQSFQRGKIKDKPYVEEKDVNEPVKRQKKKASIHDDYLQGQDIIKAIEKGERLSTVIGRIQVPMDGKRYDQPSKSDKIDSRLRSDFVDDVVVLNVKESDSIESDIMSTGHRKLFIFPKVKQPTYPGLDIRLDQDKRIECSRIKCPVYCRTTQKPPFVEYGSSHDKQKPISSLTKCIIPHVNIMPHGTDRICCASLKAWALWIKDVAESAKVWCHWINTVICDMQTITALMRGEVYNEHGVKIILTCEDWRNFAQRFNSDICIWHHYNKHVQKNTKQILNYCNCARVTQYCKLCQRDNLQSKNAEHLYKQLAVALKTTKYWRTWLHSMVLESQSLFDLIEVSCNYTAYRPKCICKCNDRLAQCSIYSIRSMRDEK